MEVTIERLGREGDGIAGALRLPFALPGERWRVDDGAPLCWRRRRSGWCRRARISGPAAAARCSMRRTPSSRAWKAETIVRALAAQGIAAPVRPMLTSPPRSRRRAVFGGRRTRKTAVVGFHGRRSESLVDIRECLVVRPEILAARPVLARLTRLAASRSGRAAADADQRAGGAGLAVSGGHDSRRRAAGAAGRSRGRG